MPNVAQVSDTGRKLVITFLLHIICCIGLCVYLLYKLSIIPTGQDTRSMVIHIYTYRRMVDQHQDYLPRLTARQLQTSGAYSGCAQAVPI